VRVVPAFDEFEDGHPGLGPGPEAPPILSIAEPVAAVGEGETLRATLDRVEAWLPRRAPLESPAYGPPRLRSPRKS
jgi:hypothetical protein